MAKATPRAAGDTPTHILDVAEQLAQKRGFNGFSYADIASEVHITTASLHYHFASKAILGQALIHRYATRFSEELSRLEVRIADVPGRLDAYANLYASVLREGRFCLCGMLAAEYETLPKPMRDAVVEFFDQNEAWLSRQLQDGREQGQLSFVGSAADEARLIVSGLEGAMLVTRPYGDVSRFQTTAAQLLKSLRNTTATTS